MNSSRRLVAMGVIVFALFSGLLTRLWFLQVAGGERLATRAHEQRQRIVQIPAMRGSIYDRNGKVLAQTVAVTSLAVDRQNLTMTERRTLEKSLGKLLGIDGSAVDKLIDNPRYPPYVPVPVVKDMDLPTAVYVAEHRDEFPGSAIASTPERRYANGALAAAALGYTGPINADELKTRRSEGYTSDDTIGKTGIEQTFESSLRGKPGSDVIQVDSDGVAVSSRELKRPTAGNDVQLTIDLDAQRIAEESLQQGIDGARGLIDPDSGDRYAANAGALVVLDARTGSLVAMASNPSYDPNDFIAGTADRYFNDPANPLIDRALNGYAPGSTFKLFTSIAMLQSGLRSPDETFDDEGCFKFGGEGEQRCNARSASYGTVDLRRALAVSSDVYFYNVGNSFWNRYRDEGGDSVTQHPVGDAIQGVARTYGFGKPTGVGLPGDQPGRIPDHAFRVEFNKSNVDDQAWRRGDSASLAVGQGDVLVTPVQLANAYAAFANGGTLFTPRLASAIRVADTKVAPDSLGDSISTFDPQTKRTTSLSPEVRRPIIDGLDGVVTTSEGTAYGAFRDYAGAQVVGKTGTAQRKPNQDTSWFVAITNPANDPGQPQYVVLAMVEQGGFGANVAAPIVRRVIDYLNGNPVPAPVTVAPPTGNEQTN